MGDNQRYTTGPALVTADPAGITVQMAQVSWTVRWTGLDRYRETDRDFVLLASYAQGYVVPKRCFASEDDIARARALVEAARAEAGAPTPVPG